MTKPFVTANINGVLPNNPPNRNDSSWDANHQNEHNDLLLSLKNALPGLNRVFKRDDMNIASPWSAVITFDILVGSDDDGGYGDTKTQAENEWKTLLTLTALKDAEPLNLDVQTIDISKVYDNNPANVFFSKLLTQKPNNALYKNNDQCWNKFIFLRYNGNKLGLITPSMLVCSKYTYEEEPVNSWLRANNLMQQEYAKISSPMEFIIDNEERSNYMLGWLSRLDDILVNNNNLSEDYKRTLCGKLSSFENEIRKEREDKNLSSNPTPFYSLINDARLIDGLSFFDNIFSLEQWRTLLTIVFLRDGLNVKIGFSDKNEILAKGKRIGYLDDDYLVRPTVGVQELRNLLCQNSTIVEYIQRHPLLIAWMQEWLKYFSTYSAKGNINFEKSFRREVQSFLDEIGIEDKNTFINLKIQGETPTEIVIRSEVKYNFAHAAINDQVSLNNGVIVLSPKADLPMEIVNLHDRCKDKIKYILPEEKYFTEKDIFLGDIYYIHDNSFGYFNSLDEKMKFALNIEPKEYTIVCPFTDKFLDQVSIGDKFSVVCQKKDSGCLVELKLASITIEKVYPFNSEKNVIQEEDLPDIRIWPYVRVQKKEEQLSCYNVVTVDKKGTIENQLVNIEEISNIKSNIDPDINVLTRNCIISRELPKYVKLLKNNNYVGAIIPKTATTKDIELPLRTYHIAVDFGTTTSTIYYASGDQDRTFLKLCNDDLMYSLIGLSFGTQAKHFIPTKEKEEEKKEEDGRLGNYYPTLYQTFADLTDETVKNPLTVGNILFNARDAYLQFAGSAKSAVDIKWDVGNGMQHYLMQIIGQVAVYFIEKHGGGDLHWNFSYPMAFDQDHVDTFKHTVKKLLKIATDKYLMNCNHDTTRFHHESMAVGRFVDLDAKTSEFNYIISADIGGQTTDVCLWERANIEAPLFHSSVKFASRTFLIDNIAEYLITEAKNQTSNIKEIELLKALHGVYPESSDILEKTLETIVCSTTGTEIVNKELRRKLDMVMFIAPNEIKNYLIKNDNGNLHKFQFCVTLGFLGLVYYILYCTAQQLKNIINDSPVSIKICLTGNGAKIFDFMENPAYITKTKRPNISALITETFKEISGRKKASISIVHDNENTKQEVAQGMLILVKEDVAQNNASPVTLDNSVWCGMNMRISSNEIDNEYAEVFSSDRQITEKLFSKKYDGTKYELIDEILPETFLKLLKNARKDDDTNVTKLKNLDDQARNELNLRFTTLSAKYKTNKQLASPFLILIEVLMEWLWADSI